MSNKNYRTLDGLFKALQRQKKTYAYEYKVQKNNADVIIYNSEDTHGAISGLLIEDLMPVLKRATWMISHNFIHDRIELVVWVSYDIK